MKVLTFSSLFPHNINPNFGIFIANRMSAFAQRGHEVKVVAPVPYFPKWPFLKIFPTWYASSKIVQHEERMGLEIFHPRYFMTPKIGMPFYGISMFLSVLPLVKKLKKSFDFDLIDAHFVYPDGLAAVLLGKILRCPVVVSARGSDITHYSQIFFIRKWLKYILESSSSAISVSSNLFDIMISLGSSSDSTFNIPNGIDGKTFYSIGQREARAKCNIPQNQKVVLGVGNLIVRKNFSLMIEAMNFLKRGEHLYIVGDGELRKKLEHEIECSNLQDRVHLVGAKKNYELFLWYNAADIFCLASLSEGSPNVVYESLACGCPVVSSNLEGAKTAIDTDAKGTIVPAWNVQDFAHALNQSLWEKEYDRKWVAQEGQKRTWDTVAMEVEAVFEKALKKYRN